MPPELSPDLIGMVKDGDLTMEQARQVMQSGKPDPAVVSLCEDLVSQEALSPVIAKQILDTIQTQEQQKHLRLTQIKVEDDNPLLVQSWSTRQEALDSVKYHSTKQGKRVMVNMAKSNSQKVIVQCASQLSSQHVKNVKDKDECVCKYHVVLRKSKNKGLQKPWRLKQGTKVKSLQHSPRCMVYNRDKSLHGATCVTLVSLSLP